MTATRLAGPRALVAGAHGGIGRACVEHLATAGGAVLGVDRDGAGDGHAIDVTRRGGAEEAIARAEGELGGLDAIVHAVGRSGRALGDGPVTTCTDEA